MQIIRYPQKTPLKFQNCITIGNFDGVHIGHQTLIKEVVQRARKAGLQSVVVTMHPLPQQYFQGEAAVDILTSFKHKYKLIKNLGVDILCVLNFNQQLAAKSATEFYQQIISKGLYAKYVVVGDDFRFGANRQGDFECLQQMAEVDGVEVRQLNTIVSADQRVSSTAIRRYLNDADFNRAGTLLGRDFNVMGRVAHGNKIGRSLGFPTINIELKQGGFPLHGIYVVKIIISGIGHHAVASVGFNPSVGGNAKRIEVYVLDFNQQVYGQCVEVLFYKKLRNEVKFDSLEALKSAIDQDVKQSREFFAQ